MKKEVVKEDSMEQQKAMLADYYARLGRAEAANTKVAYTFVPGNLVASRWMRGETGWIPGVVSHLVNVRAG